MEFGEGRFLFGGDTIQSLELVNCWKRTEVAQAIKQTICNPEAEYNAAIESKGHNDNKNVRRIGKSSFVTIFCNRENGE